MQEGLRLVCRQKLLAVEWINEDNRKKDKEKKESEMSLIGGGEKKYNFGE